MELNDVIFSRKSVRSYTGEAPSEADLNKILAAGNAAPVGMGAFDSLQLTVITSADILAQIDGACAKMFGKPDMHPLYGAPMLVLVSSKVPEGGLNNVTYSNAAIVVQNMALQATELGVGACHIWGAVAALNGAPEVVAQLQLPEGFAPCCGLALGVTDQTYEPRDIPAGRIAVATL